MIENNPFVQLLIEAINTKSVVVLHYDDKERDVEPHAVGVNTKGEAVLRCWQLDEIEGSKAGWKLMKVDKITWAAMSVIHDNFDHPRPAYVAEDSAMVEVLACL